MTTATQTEWLTADDVAERIEMSKQFVYKEAAAGRLAHTRRGRFYRFRAADVWAYIARCERAADDAPPPAPAEPDPRTGVIQTTTGRSFHRAVDAKRLVSDHECVPDPERDAVLALAGVPPELWRDEDTWVCRLLSGVGVYAAVRAGDYAVGSGPEFDFQRVLIVRAAPAKAA